MKTAASRLLLIFSLSAQPLWAANPVAETQKGGTSSATTGLTGGSSTGGGNTNLGSSSLQPQQNVNMSGSLGGTVSPAPQVGSDKTVTAAPVGAASFVAPKTQAPVTGRTGAAAPVSGTPNTEPGVQKEAPPVAPAPAQSLAFPGQAAPGQETPEAGPGAGKSLQSGVQAITKGAAEEAAGMGEGAVQQALDKIFDASQASQSPGLAGIAASRSSVADKIKKTVGLANTSAPRNAPDLYVSAVKTAEDSFPAQVAGEVKLAVLDYASRKAATALPELANQAYQSAAAGAVNEVRKTFAAMDKWEKLLAQPGEPLVANRERLESDVARVLDEGSRAALQGRTFPAPRIWFSRSGRSFNAVLPSAAVAAVPLGLSESLALKDAVAPAPFYQQALLAFQARPTLANGFKLVYQTHRGSGRTAVASAAAASSYGLKALLARIWHAVRDFALRLLGRGPENALSRGFTLEAAAAPQQAKSETVSMAGAHLILAQAEAPQPSWQRTLEALQALQAEHVQAQALLSREAPLDVQSARALFGLASAMAANHAAITGEDSAGGVARDLASRFEGLAKLEGLGPRSRLTPAMARLLNDPEGGSLRQWLGRVAESGQERVLALRGSLRANRWLSREGSASWALADLGAGPAAAKGRISGAALRAAAKMLLDSGAPQGSFAVMDGVLLGRWTGAAGSGKVLAVLAPQAQGGGIRILSEHPSDAGAAARLLSGIGFSVETRGRALSAELSGDGAEPLSEALSRAVAALQTGREPGPGASGPARGEAAAGVRKLAAELKKPQAAAVAAVLQGQAPSSLRYSFIGRVDGLWAQSARMTLDDGRVLALYALKDPATGLVAAARAELSAPGAKPQALGAAELAALLKE